MLELVFASNNTHKLREVSAILGKNITLLGLPDIGCHEEMPETGTTFTSNALQKARYVHTTYGHSCFADDSGLEVDALNGAPGVYSARYAGKQKNASDNIRKLLEELKEKTPRTARFKTVIALISGGKEYLFEGTVEGIILPAPKGTGGFGYDPVFQPEGSLRSFAEMSAEEKNRISHRAMAVLSLARFLKNTIGNR